MTWRELTLGEVVRFRRGHDLPDQARKPGIVPVIGSAGQNGWHNEALAKGPGVSIGRSGASIGKVAYTTVDYWPHNACLYVTDFLGNDPRFVYYFLKTKNLAVLNSGAAQPSLNRNFVHTLPVRIPRPNEQAAIAFILSAYDDLIENNRRRIALLEEAARLLYREWFVHFRFPGHEHVKIIDGLPEGWERRTLGDVAENHDRKRIPLSVMEREKRKGPYPYYGAATILDYVDDYIFDGRYLLMGEDGTVTTERGTPMLQLVEGQFWINNHAHILSGTSVSTEMLYCALSEYRIQGHVTGVAQPKITQKNMNRIPIVMPPEVLSYEFQEAVVGMVDQKFVLERYNQQLAEARDLLLPRLMNGEIAV